MPTANPKTIESRVRRKAARSGYGVTKSRRYVDGWDNQGAYMLFDARQNLVVLGSKYDAALDEIEEWLDQPEE